MSEILAAEKGLTALGKDAMYKNGGRTLKMSYLLPTTTSGTGQGLTARKSW